MSVIAERPGRDDVLVDVDPSWTVDALAAHLREALNLDVPEHAVVLKFNGETLDVGTAVLLDVGICGVEDRVEVGLTTRHRAQAEIRTRGWTSAPDNWMSKFANALALDERDTLRILVEAGVMGEGVVERAMGDAIAAGAVDKVLLLLDSGVPADASVPDGETYLATAAGGGHLAVVKALVERGAALPGMRLAAYVAAVRSGSYDILTYLMSEDARPQALRGLGDDVDTPLLTATLLRAARHLSEDVDASPAVWRVVIPLITAGADVNVRVEADMDGLDGYRGFSILMFAARAGAIDIVRALADAGADVNATDAAGRNALMHAAAAGHVHVVRYLVTRRCRLSVTSSEGANTLTIAVLSGDTEMVRVLLELGCSPDPPRTAPFGSAEASPVHVAAQTGHKEIASLLIAAGADVNVVSPSGRTPLHAAARGGYFDVVTLLVKNGADIGARTQTGKTSQILAMEQGHVEVWKFLSKRSRASEGCGCVVA